MGCVIRTSSPLQATDGMKLFSAPRVDMPFQPGLRAPIHQLWRCNVTVDRLKVWLSMSSDSPELFGLAQNLPPKNNIVDITANPARGRKELSPG
jgi:hypothetical protein